MANQARIFVCVIFFTQIIFIAYSSIIYFWLFLPQGTIKLGPWGGAGGVAWDFNSGSGAAIKEIVINHGDVVDSLTFTAIDRVTGEILSTAIFGGLGGQPDQASIYKQRFWSYSVLIVLLFLFFFQKL